MAGREAVREVLDRQALLVGLARWAAAPLRPGRVEALDLPEARRSWATRSATTAPHRTSEGVLEQQYPPDAGGKDYYRPTQHGGERILHERLTKLRRVVRGE